MKNAVITLITLLGIVGANFLAVKSFAVAQPGSASAADDTMQMQVTIDNFKFSPETVTIKAGTTVVFTNHDDVPHTVVAEADTFRSKAMDTDEKYSYRFATPGTYKYFCSIHPKMTGTIMVQ